MQSSKSTISGKLSLAEQMTDTADHPYVDAARALFRAGFLFNSHKERPIRAYDLNLAQIDVLFALARAEGSRLNCSEIAEHTLITKGGITGVLDRLEERGLVRRIHSREDRRSVLVELTAKASDLFRRLYPEILGHNRTLFDKAFNRAELNEFNRLVAKLIRTLEAQS